MAWELPPVAVCAACGAFLSTHNAHLISQPCRRTVEGETCGGKLRPALHVDLWRRCGCGEGSCPTCHGSGWALANSDALG